MPLIQTILIALILTVIFSMAAYFFISPEARRRKRTQAVIRGGSDQKRSGKGKKNTSDKRRADFASKLKDSRSEEKKKGKKKATTGLMIEQAGLGISVRQYWLFSAGFTFLVILVMAAMGQPPVIIILIGITAFLGMPRLFLKIKARRRQKKFLEEFPDALEATVRLLKAGMPVSEAIAMIAKEYTGPVGEEMSQVYDKQKIGIPLHDAALEATKRMPIPEMQMFATGLAIQAQTGSSLSEVLMNLSSVIRARFRLKRKVRALSAEAIASAGIIGALPNLVAFGMYFANREYIMILFENKTGNFLLGFAVIWMLIGVIVMRQMINFKV